MKNKYVVTFDFCTASFKGQATSMEIKEVSEHDAVVHVTMKILEELGSRVHSVHIVSVTRGATD